MIRRMIRVGFVTAASLIFSSHGVPSHAWTPPLGIPAPPWPADLDVARPTLPAPWTHEFEGWYFISGTGCSDFLRSNGSPRAPRCSFPSSPPPGSKIVVDGIIPGDRKLAFSGTFGEPIWVMGYREGSPPTATGTWYVAGAYKILDGIHFANAKQDGNLFFDGRNNVLRNLSFVNTHSERNGAAVVGRGSNNVMYRCTISQAGNWRHSGKDIDRHGVKVIEGANEVWYVDSLFYHIQGDGIQVGGVHEPASAINKVYIGRNRAYENLQTCFWTKNATDVIFSENVCSDINFSPGGDGQGMGGQYDPRYVWFLRNTIYNTKSGIKVSGPNHGGGGPWYAIGNRLYAIHGRECSPYGSGALNFRNDGGVTMLFNTVHDVDMFVAVASGSDIVVRNNIFSSIRSSAGCPSLSVNVPFRHDYNLYSSVAYDPGHEPHRVIADPRFVDATSANFALMPKSPAINAADPVEDPVFETFRSRYGIDIRKDFEGKIRPHASRWDIGAYEYNGKPPSIPRVSLPTPRRNSR